MKQQQQTKEQPLRHQQAPPVFKHPFTMCVSGCTGSGKTKWVLRMLTNLDTLVGPAHISGVLYCYGEVNEDVLRLQQLETESGEEEENMGGQPRRRWVRPCHALPDEEAVKRAAKACGGRLLLVLDDLMHLFTRELRIARNNAHYLVLLRNPAGALQVRSLGIQLFPGPGALHHFLEAYDDATADPFGYLLIDMHPTTRPLMRLKTHIYPGQLTVVYAPRASAATVATTSISSSSSKTNRLQKQQQQQQQQPPQKHKGPRPSKYISRNLAFFKLLSKCRSARGRAYRKLVRSATGEQLLCLVEKCIEHPTLAGAASWKAFGRTACPGPARACARPNPEWTRGPSSATKTTNGQGCASVGRPPGQRRSAPSG
ncbi:hypothetical protein niasHT_031506 [Heterodera trifolii]|uniref:Uncharacterized protein n=1 Tax=Heterodera trifolii TaxID=157864 RepID=A0ABD2I848_9BILA